MSIKFDTLEEDLLRELGSRPNKWISFRDLALWICGDSNNADVLSSIAASKPDLFVIHQDARVRLTQEGVRRAAQRFRSKEINPKKEIENSVREYLRQLQPVRIRVLKTDQGQQVLERYVHGLVLELTDNDPKLPDDTPVELISVNGRRNSGHIVGSSRDESRVFVGFRYEVSHEDLPAALEISRSEFFVKVADQIATLNYPPALWAEFNGAVREKLFSDNSTDVALSLLKLTTPWARLLWGPPGAGKTHCLAELTAVLADGNRSERTLIVAPSNVAVDAAIIELVRALESRAGGKQVLNARKIFRYGYPGDERVLCREELFGPPEFKELSQEIFLSYKQVRALREHRAADSEIAQAQSKLQQLQQARKMILRDHLKQAKVVATTIASAFTGTNPVSDGEELGTKWDTVIVDEASMVNGALILLLSSLALRRFLVVGDPRQLAPIFEWQNHTSPPAGVIKWLSKDPYEIAGLSQGLVWQKIINTEDGRMVRVLAQRRCHPRIWQLTAALYPAVKSAVDTKRLETIAAAPPLSGESTVFLDLSTGRIPLKEVPETSAASTVATEYESACRRVGRSWENPSTAMLAIDVAREIRAHSPEASIAIITPYRGQLKLIRRWLHDEIEADCKLGQIQVGTVHSFQGGEADAVIFDIVDGPPRSNLGMLLRDDTGMRLTNVAITRARGKLILIAHKDWLRDVNPARAGLLWNILFGGNAPKPCHVLPLSNNGSSEEPQTESPIEEVFVQELRRKQSQLSKFTLQYRIFDKTGRIISRPDVAFINQKLAVFCDGALYHLQKSQWQRDLRQRRELTALGWQVVAFTGSEILKNVENCVEEVINILSRYSRNFSHENV